MSVCQNCKGVGGYHHDWCPIPHAPTEYEPRIEYFGRLQVHQPIKRGSK
jgi:hypothetical protein